MLLKLNILLYMEYTLMNNIPLQLFQNIEMKIDARSTSIKKYSETHSKMTVKMSELFYSNLIEVLEYIYE